MPQELLMMFGRLVTSGLSPSRSVGASIHWPDEISAASEGQQPLAAIHLAPGATPIWLARAVVADHRAHRVGAVAVGVARRGRRRCRRRRTSCSCGRRCRRRCCRGTGSPAPGGRTARRCRCWRRRCPRRWTPYWSQTSSALMLAMPHSTALTSLRSLPFDRLLERVLAGRPQRLHLVQAGQLVDQGLVAGLDPDRVGRPEGLVRRPGVVEQRRPHPSGWPRRRPVSAS